MLEVNHMAGRNKVFTLWGVASDAVSLAVQMSPDRLWCRWLWWCLCFFSFFFFFLLTFSTLSSQPLPSKFDLDSLSTKRSLGGEAAWSGCCCCWEEEGWLGPGESFMPPWLLSQRNWASCLSCSFFLCFMAGGKGAPEVGAGLEEEL